MIRLSPFARGERIEVRGLRHRVTTKNKPSPYPLLEKGEARCGAK